jgi:bifunctional enzyme CysN/CysC
LHRAGHHTIVFDGDNIRHGPTATSASPTSDRVENIRRIA